MENGHGISDEVLREIQTAIANHEHWLAYNTLSYFLEKADVLFFKSSEAAEEFSMNNISDHDSFKVIKILSVDDAVKQIPYGKALDNYLNDASKETQSLTNVDNKSSKDLSEKNLDELMNKLITLGFSTRLIPAIEF